MPVDYKTIFRRPDGIYFNLDNEEYHADPALGSTNIRALRVSIGDYWWHSWMNPARPKNKETPSTIFGSALHADWLEGRKVFERRYVRRPDDPPDATPADKSKITKEAKRDLCGNGEKLLHGDDYDRILAFGRVVELDPELSGAMHPGEGLSELSMFWTRPDGVQMKVRYDYIKPRAFVDIKSITNTMGLDFRQACRNSLSYRGYLLQGTHYMGMRTKLPALYRDGKIFGKPSDKDAELLKRIAAVPSSPIVWVFFQSDDAPIVYSLKMSPQNPIVSYEVDRIEEGIARYKSAVETFGTQQMWSLNEPMTELDESELPSKYGQNG